MPGGENSKLQINAELPRRLRRHPFTEGELASGNHTPLLYSFREEEKWKTKKSFVPCLLLRRGI
jgi:hypothetical protein